MEKHFFILCLVLLWAVRLGAEPIPAGYYDRVNGLKDAQLKGTLKSIIRPHTAIPYGSGANSTWGVFYYSDRDENGLCMDMYCDDWKPLTSVGAVAAGCNIEHSMANSWWGGIKNDLYKDCYHLNPSNSSANSARSNYALGEPTKKITYAGSLTIGQMFHPDSCVYFDVFMPKDEYKGDFARAYFYMATCYGYDLNGKHSDLPANDKKKYVGWRIDNKGVSSYYAMQNDNYLEFQDWEIAVLLKWHRQDPVSEKEIKRQDAISNFQHNRNPYIDYPDLVEYIWGVNKGKTYMLTTDLDEMTQPATSVKYMENGHLYIRTNGVVYDVQGNVVQK